MSHFKKILLLCALLLFVVFVVVSLRTQKAEAPTTTVTLPQNTTSRTSEETASPTPTAPIPNVAGVTRDLRNQGLTEAPRALFEEKSIEILNLSGNQLTSLQAEVRQLTKLRILDLSNNTLTNIPAELGQLSNLEILNLQNNKLTGLPYELGNLKNLKTLDLRGNDYAKADLVVIKKSLPTTVTILTD